MSEKKVIDFICKFTKTASVDKDSNLFENGNLNSLFIMQLILFIEKEFNIAVDNDVIGTSEFNSVSSICAYIEKKLQ